MPEPARSREAKLLAEVAAVYRDLEAQPIERQCRRTTECCQFQLTRRMPQVTRGEARLAVRAWRATGRKKLPEPAIAGACPFLRVDGGCQVYAQRPFGCRTHFCAAAGGPIARREVLPPYPALGRDRRPDERRGAASFSRRSGPRMACGSLKPSGAPIV